ncbi:hypothetical protein [Mycolicibacterium sp. lyk4-40-TYG-92]|uniref:hypothetical protein n=1 Tax=Mycolicibacterium sp. lyk4-40-TYG-92 TaxID=3040295 RepID=UPI0025519DD1|nr:hypothetical protein [Mycolicibacterium sp. lyk4-40-TYG-92]
MTASSRSLMKAAERIMLRDYRVELGELMGRSDPKDNGDGLFELNVGELLAMIAILRPVVARVEAREKAASQTLGLRLIQGGSAVTR